MDEHKTKFNNYHTDLLLGNHLETKTKLTIVQNEFETTQKELKETKETLFEAQKECDQNKVKLDQATKDLATCKKELKELTKESKKQNDKHEQHYENCVMLTHQVADGISKSLNPIAIDANTTPEDLFDQLEKKRFPVPNPQPIQTIEFRQKVGSKLNSVDKRLVQSLTL